MLTDDLLQTLDEQLCAQLDQARACRELPLVTLERRPAPDRWSVLEVCEHLNILSGHYLRHLQAAYVGPAPDLRKEADHRPGLWGGLLTKAMRPGKDGSIPWRMRTLRIFEPRQAPVKRIGALDDLIDLLGQLRAVVREAMERGTAGPRITSTLGPLFRFKIADALNFAVAHQERHFMQIQRTLEALR